MVLEELPENAGPKVLAGAISSLVQTSYSPLEQSETILIRTSAGSVGQSLGRRPALESGTRPWTS